MRIKAEYIYVCIAIFCVLHRIHLFAKIENGILVYHVNKSSEVIPHSKYSFQTAKLKKKVIEPGELSPLSDWEYQLSKGWK